MKHSKAKAQSATKLLDHVRELQMRFLASFGVLIISSVVVYFFYEPILSILRAPLHETLYYSSPVGSFAFVMKVCFMGALAITMPVITYNLIMFVRPAFDKHLSSKRVYIMTIASAVLSVLGVLFAYLVILPGTLQFFSGFDTKGISALISADSYLTFVTNIIITFVIIFQLPIVLTVIDKIKPLTPKKMLGLEKWVVIGSLIISLITPFTYDLVTSLLVGLPIVVLYNLSIIIIIMQHKYYQHKEFNTVRATIIQPPKDNQSFIVSDSLVKSITDDSLTTEVQSSSHNTVRTKIAVGNNYSSTKQSFQRLTKKSGAVNIRQQIDFVNPRKAKLQPKVASDTKTIKHVTIS